MRLGTTRRSADKSSVKPRPTTAKKQAELEIAKSIVQTFVRISVDIPDDWWKKFDRLYRQIQSDLGQSPNPLERPTTIVLASAPDKNKPRVDETNETTTKTAAEKTTAKKDSEAATHKSGSGTTSVAVFLLIIVGGGGASIWMMINKKSRKKSIRLAHDMNVSNVTFMAADDDLSGDLDFEIPVVATLPKASSAKKAGNAKKPSRPKGT